MRAEHNQVGMPLFRSIDDHGFRVTLLDGCAYINSVRAQRFRSLRNQSLRLLRFFVPNCIESRVISTHVAGDEERGWFYDMQYPYLGISRMCLPDHGLYGRVGEFGVVDRQQDLHSSLALGPIPRNTLFLLTP